MAPSLLGQACAACLRLEAGSWAGCAVHTIADRQAEQASSGPAACQARQVFSNLGRALAAAGAGPEHVSRITIYVVNYRRDEHLPIIEAARVMLFGDHKPVDTLIGVAALSPDYLIEVDAIAVVDG